MEKTKHGTLEEIKLKDGKYKLIHKRAYCTETIEVKNEKALKELKKELVIKPPRKKKADANDKNI